MKRLVKSIVTIGTVLVALLVAYGVLVEPRVMLDEQRHEAMVPGLTSEADGTEIAVIADLQVGMWFANIDMIERIVDRVVEEDPAALLIAGDFVYGEDPRTPETVSDLLEPVREAGIPVFAVLGNHDYLSGESEALIDELKSRDVNVLQNESAALPLPSSSTDLRIVGVAPAYNGLADVQQSLEGVPETAPRVVMMHNPTTFPSLPSGTAPLAVAGHTHCGQIAVPGTPDWSWLAWTTDETMVADGFAPQDYGQQGNTLFVTCGIGFSNLPMRVSAPPQLVFFDLQATS
ncbi:metallophosphoesterase [Arthrobacter sp. TMS2-4]